MKLVENIYYMGLNDRRTAYFENLHPLERGVSYNSFLILDEKTALIDSVDKSVAADFFEDLINKLDGRNLDYLVMQHVEPDHASLLREIITQYPDVIIVGSAIALKMLKQFNDLPIDKHFKIIKEGDQLSFGKREITFYAAPMVHWPEVMFSYESSLGILFSADAFGAFDAHNGRLFSDEIDYFDEYVGETRRYYSNIVGKFGAQVQVILKKLANLDIKMIFPTHGLMWRGDKLAYILEKYNQWSTYTPEENGVVIAYASMYGNTQKVANMLAMLIAQRTDASISVYDVSKTHVSHIVSESFKLSNIVVASPTYNLELYPLIHQYLCDLAALNFKNRAYSIIGNGTWASVASKKAEEMLSSMKNMTKIGETFEILSAFKNEQITELEKLADEIADSLGD